MHFLGQAPHYPELLYDITAALAVTFILRELVTVKDITPARYVLTPLVTFWICLAAVLGLASSGPSTYRGFVIAGLILSLVADTILMVKEIDLLKYGLVFFLGAHAMYICAFAGQYAFAPWHIPLALVMLSLVVVLFLRVRGRTGGLDIPVLVYSCTIMVMVFLAVAFNANEGGNRGLFALTGAVLFLVSDGILACNAFLRPIRHASAVVWAFYAPGQLLIALSMY